MLEELTLRNFRIFDDEVKLRCRPITIIIGRNSSGKSSAIKFLLMLKQSVDHGGSDFLITDGSLLNLGPLPDLKSRLSKKRNLAFSLLVRGPTLTPPTFVSSYLQSQRMATDLTNLSYTIDGSIPYSSRARFGRTSYSLVSESLDRPIATISQRILDDSSFLRPERRLIDTTFSADLDLAIADRSTSIRSKLTSLRDELKRTSQELQFASVQEFLLETLRYELNSISHLLPVRDESQRIIVASSPPPDYVGQRGQFALSHLQRILLDDRPRYRFILPYLKSVAGIDDVDFQTSTAGYVVQAYAKNITTGASVLLADYGFGVGQSLPILVQGAIMAPYTTLVVEQPEAQLHPTAQLELGSFFADLWKERKVGSLIETHSGNILLRLRRLIARGDLSNQDVSVAYFAFDKDNQNMPVVRNLEINDDGSMEAGLPMEFFGADVIEGLSLGARA